MSEKIAKKKKRREFASNKKNVLNENTYSFPCQLSPKPPRLKKKIFFYNH